MDAAEVLLTSPWQTRTMSVGELLMTQRGWGRVRVRRLLLSLAVPENKQIGKLTERQRLAIALLRGARARRLPRHEAVDASRYAQDADLVGDDMRVHERCGSRSRS